MALSLDLTSVGSLTLSNAGSTLSLGTVVLANPNIYNLLNYSGDVVSGDWGPALAACINASLSDAYGAVYIPAGRYNCKSAVIISDTAGANLTIFGDGPDASQLFCTHTDVCLTINQFSANPFGSISIRSLGFYANNGPLMGQGNGTAVSQGYYTSASASGTTYTSYLAEAALRLALNVTSDPFICLLLEDVRIYGVGSSGSYSGGSGYVHWTSVSDRGSNIRW
jgi:hypothetical protein